MYPILSLVEEGEDGKEVDIPYDLPVDTLDNVVVFGKELPPFYFFKYDSEPDSEYKIKN